VNVLVLGGTGTVGSQVFHELLKRECEVTVLTRSGDRAKNLPKNAHAVIGGLLDPVTVRSIFKMTFDFKLMYAFFQENGLKAAPKDMERQRELQGWEPKRYEDFVEETSKMWKER